MDTTQNPEALHSKVASAKKTTDAFVNPQVPGALLGLTDLKDPQISQSATDKLREKLDVGNAMNPIVNTL